MADIVYLPIDHLRPHPLNPRKDLGDLSELAASIKENGILQNLTVVPIACVPTLTGRKYGETSSADDDLYVVVIGHRRLAAATMAGEETVPCSIVNMSQGQQQETMLIENMQRSDLTVYEQAQGFQMMLDMGHSVQTIVTRTGFSETTVRRRLKMAELDQEKLKEVSCRQLSLQDFDELSKIEDINDRNNALEKIGTNDFESVVKRVLDKQAANRNRPAVIEWLKSVKAKALERSDTWSNKYDHVGRYIWIAKWQEDEANTPPADLPEKLFYYLDDNSLQLFKQHEKAKPEKKSPEELAEAKAVNEARKVMEEASTHAYDLRKQFVNALPVTNKNKEAVMKGLISAACLEAIDFNSPDRKALSTILDIPENYSSDRMEKLAKALGTLKTSDLAKLVYAFFGDSEKVNCNDSYRFPMYKLNVKLNLLYDWLTSLGYEMSSEEMQLLNGEHEVYSRGKNYG